MLLQGYLFCEMFNPQDSGISSGNKKRRFPASFLFVCGYRFLKERFLKSVFG